MENFIDNQSKENLLSVIKDPFEFQNIITLRLGGYVSVYKVWTFYAIVEFQNGNTKGEQKFEGSDMDSVYLKMRTFVEQMSKK